MLLAFTNLTLVAFMCAITSVVYIEILQFEKVLAWWFRFGNRYSCRWFYAPVWGCIKCCAGQLALWFYLITSVLAATGRITPVSGFCLYNPLALAYQACLAVVLSQLVYKFLHKQGIVD